MDLLRFTESIELRHLRYFIAVAEELSFSRAAERLHIAQPPLTQQIQTLEAKLGAKLFDRKRPLQLTQAGKAFLEEALAIRSTLAQAAHKTQRIHQGELGYLTVGFTSSMANGILPNILRTFRQQYPDVKLILKEDNSVFQLQRLRDRATDIIFFYQDRGLADAKDLAVMPLLQESLVVVLPQNHPLANRAEIAVIDLEHEQFIMPDRQVVPGLFEHIYYLCTQAGFVPKVAQEAIFTVTILGLVAGEIGIGILPASVTNLQRQGVVYLPMPGQTSANQLNLVWRDRDPSTILPHFLDIVRNFIDSSSD
jgi:DNA-binding transcriptional LysR family regulator